MNRSDIEEAINSAKKGIAKYLEIMDSVSNVDVSKNTAFQTKYNGFYRVRQRSQAWYQNYYKLMQELKATKPTFTDVLDELKKRTKRYEPSFSSKLVATLNPEKPVWDIHILANTEHKAPSYSSKEKFALAKSAYQSLDQWYETFIPSADGKLCIAVFNEKVPEHKQISNLKKIDFIFWQTRYKSLKKKK